MSRADRAEATTMLSRLLEKRLESRKLFWSAEVSFDKGTSSERRIDYVAFKPFTPQYSVEPTSVELGRFECYEVKSCMADFQSGHGLTFYGDRNYLVCTRGLAELLQGSGLVPREINGMLVPDAGGNRLIVKGGELSNERLSYRKRPASEMLWQMVQAHDWGAVQPWQAGNKRTRVEGAV